MLKVFIFLNIFLQITLFANSLYNQNILKKIENKYGGETLNRFLLLKEIIAKNKNKSDIEKIEVINSFFNKVRYVSDKTVWKKKDYWATPYEFLSKDKGDSEDFVFAKYFTLVKELGIDSNKLYFSYVKSLKKNVSYMVLTYYENKKSIPFIIDAINYRVLKASKRRDIVPIYSFSAKSAGLGAKNSQQSKKFKNLLYNLKRGKV